MTIKKMWMLSVTESADWDAAHAGRITKEQLIFGEERNLFIIVSKHYITNSGLNNGFFLQEWKWKINDEDA